ncbi:hypothetical protein SAMN05444287_1960 [Octadecabacter temperatus]|uniref:Uncharacterized protein n=1 Tax=Octadecabacter temperatus TaxID=1458307 RepID=A0A0K0Y7H8_9RHOB|nr:hypothetical protein [Octadecabacter temperatus]AKS46836.1 hypothetical protein OSB_23000 [Octadecabacter temperatus]SIO22210.1 hypothetical protein SAMN05444287_1960 [Octadecabacter temperatus]
MKHLLFCLISLFPTFASAEIGDVAEATLDGTAGDGTILLSNGWSGRIWGIEPNETYVDFLWETYGGTTLTCQHVGSTSIRLTGLMISDPTFICISDNEYLHDAAIAAGAAAEACAATGGALGGDETGACLSR